MEQSEKDQLIKSLKKHPLTLPENGTVVVDYDKDIIHKLIPHRPPFSLVNRICKINPEHQILEAEATVKKDDPVFEGHFPENPVYPGVFQIEMMGQAGLCLSAFIMHQSTDYKQVKPIEGLFTRVHNAGFIGQILPGDTLQIFVQLVEYDHFLGMVAAQIIKDGQIISHCISEVYFLE